MGAAAARRPERIPEPDVIVSYEERDMIDMIRPGLPMLIFGSRSPYA